jgi:hypothetical protein
MTHSSQPRPDHPHLAVTRRTLARGAAWSVPVLATVAAAPALAASGGPGPGSMTMTWFDAQWTPSWSGAESDMGLNVLFDNRAGSAQATVTRVDVYSTYHAPATNNVADQLIATSPSTLALPVNAKAQASFGFPIFSWSWQPPVDGSNQNIALTYYNGGPSTVPCVSAQRHPSDAGYPAFGTQLTNDKTYIVVTYSAGGGTYALRADMGATVSCRVNGFYCTK